MPVTARLSRRFYERFGDDLTNELVDWLNSVDATYRSDLRDLNETNFARFDAKLEQRTAVIEAKLDQRTAEIEAKLEQRAAAIEAKLEQRATAIEARIDGLESRFDQKFTTLEAKVATSAAELREAVTQQLGTFESRMMRWMFTMWTGSMLAAAALFFAVLRR